MMRKLLVTLLLCGMVSLYGWCEVAHYLIALKSGAGDAAAFANLPDAWESQEEIITYFTTGLHFRWSHGVVDQGTLNALGPVATVPKIPAYPDDGRYPGKVMLALLDNRLDLSSGYWGDHGTLELVCKGFRLHNLADRKVHWEFFRGAEANMDMSERRSAWTVHHGLKETWAEYLLLKHHSPGGQLVFDAAGCVVPPEDCNSLEISDLEGKLVFVARFLRLAQQVFRKGRTRHCLKTGEEGYQFEVQSVAMIKATLRSFNDRLKGHFGKSHWARWEACEFNFLDDYVRDNGDGTTTVIQFETPATQQAEYLLLQQAEEKFLKEVKPYKRRLAIGFIWDRKILFTKFNECMELVKSWR